ncbi:MAG: sulfatase-like hydrolase/transferase [Myxococcota bacterium]
MDALWRLAYRLAFRLQLVYWRVRRPTIRGAYVAVWRGDELLCIRNSYRRSYSLPAGGLARGEQPIDAAIRELREEVALVAAPDELHFFGEIVSHAGNAEDHAHFYELRRDGDLDFRVDGREVVWAGFLSPREALDRGVVDVVRQYLERHLLVLLALASLACGAPEPPNLVLVSIDTLRADHTQPYGYARETTPTLQRLADQGLVFEQAYSASASTGPSHATLFTGAHVLSHGLVKNGLDLIPENETLAETLGAAGYQTGAVVGSFVLDASFGFDQGFDRYDAEFRRKMGGAGVWKAHKFEIFERRADEATDVAIEWLDTLAPDRPFFLFVHYYDPHAGYDPPGDWLTRFGDDVGRFTAEHRVERYDAEIAWTDHQLERLLARVEQLAPPERTLVVVTADHGEGLGDHGVPGHGVVLYEEAVRVPLVLRWPGRIDAGLRIAAPVGSIDVMPTLLELMGVDAPAGVQGQSLAGVLWGASPPYRRPVFLVRRHYKRGYAGLVPVNGYQFGVRSGRWKWIEDPNRGTRELFDLEHDPREQSNLADTLVEDAAQLGALVADWRAGIDGPPEVKALEARDRRALEALGYVE